MCTVVHAAVYRFVPWVELVGITYSESGKIKLRYLFIPPGCTPYRRRLERVFRPGMLGIAPFEFFAHLEIGSLPEATEVGSHLYGLEARREQVHHHRCMAVVYARCIQQAEYLLQAHSQYGRFAERRIL